MKLFIEQLKRLTDDNNHTEARVRIASRYEYLKRELIIYKAIRTLSDYSGKISRENLKIRLETDNLMMNKIKFGHGKVISDLIEGAL